MLKSKSTYKYLDFVKFSQLYNWSVQYLKVIITHLKMNGLMASNLYWIN